MIPWLRKIEHSLTLLWLTKLNRNRTSTIASAIVTKLQVLLHASVTAKTLGRLQAFINDTLIFLNRGKTRLSLRYLSKHFF